MVAFTLIPFLLAVASPFSTSAAPLEGLTTTTSIKGAPVFPPINYGLLCQLPILEAICGRAPPVSTTQVTTPLGVAQGVPDAPGANRFPVRYASATRWAASTLATKWQFP
jgi:hypothetical protein